MDFWEFWNQPATMLDVAITIFVMGVIKGMIADPLVVWLRQQLGKVRLRLEWVEDENQSS